MKMLSMLRPLIVDSRGAEIAEAAAVLPLMFMILLGIFWFGQAFSIYGAITRAAQDGARAGALPYCTTCTGTNTPVANAVNAVQNSLTASHLNVSLARPPIPPQVVSSCSSGGTSGCSALAGPNICVQPSAQLSTPTAGAAGACGVSVSFQYPFQFWLPFTSLNNQRIWLTASARARTEAP